MGWTTRYCSESAYVSTVLGFSIWVLCLHATSWLCSECSCDAVTAKQDNLHMLCSSHILCYCLTLHWYVLEYQFLSKAWAWIQYWLCRKSLALAYCKLTCTHPGQSQHMQACSLLNIYTYIYTCVRPDVCVVILLHHVCF